MSSAVDVVEVVVFPLGVVTKILFGSRGSIEQSIRYPAGKKVLNPDIRSGWPLNSVETRLITPGVSILVVLKLGLR